MKQEYEIFEQALALSSSEDREAYLLAACGQNRELRRSVDGLLAAFKEAVELAFLQSGDRTQEETVRRRVALQILQSRKNTSLQFGQMPSRPESTKPESRS